MDCPHLHISPIVEKDERGKHMVYSSVCQNCMKILLVSPMTVEEYWRQNK